MRSRTILEYLDPVDEAAVERAMADRVFDELVDQLVADGGDSLGDSDTVTLTLLRRPPQHRRRGLVALAAAVVILAGALAGVPLLGSSSPLHGSLTTPWRAARLFSPSPGAHTKTGTWRLVDAQLRGTWQQNVDGPPPGRLTCATPRACYVLSGRFASSAANARLLSETLYVSADAGATWSALPMPDGFAATSALSCATATWCADGGTYQGKAVLATTADGGHSFTIAPLPHGVGTLRTLSCSSIQFCGGLVARVTAGQKRSATGTPPDADATFLSVTDGGQVLVDEPIASGESMSTLACTSSRNCLAIGRSDATGPYRMGTAVGAVTTDGGRSWHPSTFPAGFGLSPYDQLSCTDTQHCMVLGAIPVMVGDVPECTSMPRPPNLRSPRSSPTPPPAMSPAVRAISQVESQLATSANIETAQAHAGFTCSYGNWTAVSDVAATADGGRSWAVESLPGNVLNPELFGLACATSTECWLAGSQQAAQTVGKIHDGSSSVLLGTTNGGATWSNVAFSTPATAPNPTGQSYLGIGSISCPSARGCVATGAASATASTAPVYRLVIPGG